MKQLLMVALAGILAIGTWMYFQDSDVNDLSFDDGSSATTSTDSTRSSDNGSTTGVVMSSDDEKKALEEEADDEEAYDDRPAAEVYASAEEALEAIKKGALDYDDIVLEQFVEPGEDCTWCDTVYKQVTEMMLDPEANEDEQAYYSEILAISGNVDHIKTLVESVREAEDEDAADIFAESLELSIGDDEIVEYLAGFTEDSNELLQESAVAAITNQGSKLAAETLYEYSVKKGDPTGDYDLGIGLAEMIPDEETLPYLQEVVLKRDDYSHLGVKALLNYGHDGVVIVVDALSNSDDSEFDQKLLADALDHMVYEEETEKLFKKIVDDPPSPVVKQLAEDSLEQFKLEEDLDDEEEDDDFG